VNTSLGLVLGVVLPEVDGPVVGRAGTVLVVLGLEVAGSVLEPIP
jgi:hypothetical protein